jgi:hypothetical protein
LLAFVFCSTCSDIAEIAFQASRWFPVQSEAAKKLIMTLQIAI